MARIRYLKPDFFFDDKLAELKFEARLIFQGLWCHADRDGRLEDNPKVLKAKIMPYDKVNMDMILFDLAEKFITRYDVEGRKYIQINNFSKHQKPHHTEKKSVIPECNGDLTVKEPLELGRNGNGNGNGEGNGEDKDKEKHLEFVFLKPEEYEKLKSKFGEAGAKSRIDNLDLYAKKIGNKKFKAKYDSHYATILSWDRNSDQPTKSKPDRFNLKEVDYTKGTEGFK